MGESELRGSDGEVVRSRRKSGAAHTSGYHAPTSGADLARKECRTAS